VSERCRTRALILVHSQEVHDGWVRLAETLPWVRGRGLAFGVLTGELQATVAARREREPHAPIGYIAGDQSSVLEALAGGADEAAVVTPYDAAQLAAFVDRLELRARLRAESQRTQEAFAHSERLMALGTLVAGVGHEINNPLSAVILSIEVARRRMLPALEAARAIAAAADAGAPPPPHAVATLAKHAAADQGLRGAAGIFDDMGAAADAIASIVRDLRTFARSDQDEPSERVEVDELIEHAIRLSGREASRRGVLERDYAPNLPQLVVPRGRVTQVIMNVFINAFHAIAEVDNPKHRVRISARADDEFVAITVSDTGPGIPPESLERIFDPFFTTKRQGLGTGLGLSISRAILRRLGGELSVESVYGEGATFLCFLPIPSPELLTKTSRSPTMSTSNGESTPARSILVVDDDERVLRSYARLLGARHRIMVAYDGLEAIDMIRSGSSPDVLVVELELPGEQSRKLLAWLASDRPDLARRTILATSGASDADGAEFLRDYRGTVVLKPVHGRELLAAIDAVASGGRSEP
jgi:signal transduction histidine kinase/ActR/RegA family two-component response regulator